MSVGICVGVVGGVQGEQLKTISQVVRLFNSQQKMMGALIECIGYSTGME